MSMKPTPPTPQSPSQNAVWQIPCSFKPVRPYVCACAVGLLPDGNHAAAPVDCEARRRGIRCVVVLDQLRRSPTTGGVSIRPDVEARAIRLRPDGDCIAARI